MTTTKSQQGALNEKIGMNEFFALPIIRQCQEIQKRNRFGSEPHKQAHSVILETAKKYGVERFIGSY